MKFRNGYVILAVISLIGSIIPIDSVLRRISRKFQKNKRLRPSQIIGSLKLPLKYCQTKALIHERPLAARHCIKRWNRSYSKYCTKTKGHVTVKCERLRRKVSEIRTAWRNSRLKYSKFRSRRQAICGKQLINYRKYGCCGGISYKLETRECCHTQIYEEEKEGCCRGKVYSKENQDCCYDIVFDKRNETCCALQVISIDGTQKTVCCGNETIDARRYFCSNGTVLVKDNFWNDSRQNTTQSSGDSQGSKQVYSVVWITLVLMNLVLVEIFVLSICLIRRVWKNRTERSRAIDMSKSEKATSSATTVLYKRLNNSAQVVRPKRKRTDKGMLDVEQSAPRKLIPTKNINTVEKDPENPSSSYDESGPVSAVKKRVIEEFSEVLLNVDSGTQTVDIKPVNIPNSMGRPFDQKFAFNPNKKTLQIPDSSAILTLSDADTREETTCLASTFRNLPEIYTKLQLEDGKCIASPAVEYLIIGKPLTTLAKVTMPFIGDSGRLTVLKVKSDHGSEKLVETKEIKRFDDSSRGDDEEYYEITAPGQLAIYILSMSWLVCTTCNQEHHPFNLEEIVFGRLEVCTENPAQLQASIGSYIVDDIHLIPDYLKPLEDDEKRKQRVQVLRRRLKIPPKLHMLDSIRISLTLEPPNGSWEHRSTSEGGLLQSEEEDVPLHSITGCHRERRQNGRPFAKEWYLRSTNASNGQAGPLSCIVSTAHVSHLDGTISKSDRHLLYTEPMYVSFYERQKNKDTVETYVGIESRDVEGSDRLHANPENPSEEGELALLRPNRLQENVG